MLSVERKLFTVGSSSGASSHHDLFDQLIEDIIEGAGESAHPICNTSSLSSKMAKCLKRFKQWQGISVGGNTRNSHGCDTRKREKNILPQLKKEKEHWICMHKLTESVKELNYDYLSSVVWNFPLQ